MSLKISAKLSNALMDKMLDQRPYLATALMFTLVLGKAHNARFTDFTLQSDKQRIMSDVEDLTMVLFRAQERCT